MTRSLKKNSAIPDSWPPTSEEVREMLLQMFDRALAGEDRDGMIVFTRSQISNARTMLEESGVPNRQAGPGKTRE
jgi:hypothetical protein